MVFCNKYNICYKKFLKKVTILILIDGFLQWGQGNKKVSLDIGHNPYFNRWFSAIMNILIIMLCLLSHNPYFNRWFSAIYDMFGIGFNHYSHNPYFNRWFSAML